MELWTPDWKHEGTAILCFDLTSVKKLLFFFGITYTSTKDTKVKFVTIQAQLNWN
jgi:hypothetical protein